MFLKLVVYYRVALYAVFYFVLLYDFMIHILIENPYLYMQYGSIIFQVILLSDIDL